MNSDRLHLRTSLHVPPRGGSVRVAMGACELILEGVRGGHSLLWHAGREARRHVLGLGDAETLTLELRPPELPVRLLLRETITLAPGARVRGYVQVPLVPTLCNDHGGERHDLLAFAPASLAADWDPQRGAVFCCSSSWFLRYPVHGGEARMTLPLSLRNDTGSTCTPDHLPLAIMADELQERRAGIGAAPRRLRFDGSSWQTTVRRGTNAAKAAEVVV